MRTISALALVACALGFPGALRAADLTFALDGAVEYDSNVFRSHDDEKDDFLFRLRPVGAARRRARAGPQLLADLRAARRVRRGAHAKSTTSIRSCPATADYHVNDRLDLYARNTFRYVRSELRTNFDGTQSAADSPFINEERDRFTLNDAVVGSPLPVHAAPRRHGGDPARLLQPEPQRPPGELAAPGRHATSPTRLTPKLSLGGGASVAHQKFYESRTSSPARLRSTTCSRAGAIRSTRRPSSP